MLLNISLNSRTIGILIMIPTSILLLWTIAFSILMTAWGFGSGVSLSEMLPFIALSLLKLSLLIFAIYAGIRYLKNKPFKRNKLLGLLLILLGMIYFIYDLSTVLHDNITGLNPGGELRPIEAFVWGLVSMLLGLGFRNCREEQPI